MTSKLFSISEDGWNSLCSFHEVIKLLFNVHITRFTNNSSYNENGSRLDDSDSEWLDGMFLDNRSKSSYKRHKQLKILLETNGPVENIEKTQTFSCACFPLHPNYTAISIQFNDSDAFEMVHQHAIQIQRSTASLLTFHHNNLSLFIQGHENCVELARLQISKIINNKFSNAISDVESPQKTSDDVSKSQPGDKELSFYDPKAEYLNTVDKGEPETIEIDGFSCSPLDYNLKPSVDVIASPYKNKCIPLNQKSYHSSQVLELDVEDSKDSCKDDCQDNLVSVLTDPHNVKQVEQVIKLGYSPNQIKIAIQKLGPGCSKDILLSELIKIGNEQQDNKTGVFENDASDDTASFNDLSLEIDQSSLQGPLSLQSLDSSENLRSIVIDGSNVAMSHGQDTFSCKGIQIAVNWFQRRGHTDITVFVPKWRKETSRPDAPIEDQNILLELERERILTFTPSRRVQGRRIISYDDRYILKHAVDVEGIIVSNDIYRDLVRENVQFKKIVDEQLLTYAFVKDKFMPPDDPLGRTGPTLDDFLRKVPAQTAPRPPDCPYGKKCTYGNKCRFYHPGRNFSSQKSISEMLKEQASASLMEIAQRKANLASDKGKRQKQKLVRTRSLIPEAHMSVGDVPELPPFRDGGHRQKPRLLHSQSLILSSQTYDHLTLSGLKLEEAEPKAGCGEGEAFVEKVVCKPKESASEIPKNVEVMKEVSDIVSAKYSPSPRTSPVPQTSVNVLAEGPQNRNLANQLKGSVPMSFSHLAVPSSPAAQESYSSGHLSVAKKLSDEGSEKSFFVGSKSPSPTLSLMSETTALDGKTVAPTPGVTHHEDVVQDKSTQSQDVSLKPRNIFCLERDGTYLYNNKTPFGGSPYQSMDSGHYSMVNSFPSFTHSSTKTYDDQGRPIPYGSLSSSRSADSPDTHSGPNTKHNPLLGHLNMQHSFSNQEVYHNNAKGLGFQSSPLPQSGSTSSPLLQEHFNMGSRTELISPNQFANQTQTSFASKTQPSYSSQPKPSFAHQQHTNFAHQPQTSFTHQPQTSFAHQPQTSFTHQPQTSFAHQPQTNFAHQPQTSFTHQPQTSFVHQPQTNFAHQPQTSFAHQPQTSFAHQPQTSFAHQPQTNFAHQPQTNFAHQPSTNFAHQPQTSSAHQPHSSFVSQPTYSPNKLGPSVTFHQLPPAQVNSISEMLPLHGPPHQQTYAHPHTMPHQQNRHTIPHHSHHHPMGYQSDWTTQFSPYAGSMVQTSNPMVDTSHFYQPANMASGQPTHHHFNSHHFPQAYHNLSTITPSSPATSPFEREAPISQDDTRYSAYCHLSSVFGEKVVRHFMNRNPDVKDERQLIDLIAAYKVETGL